MKIDVFLPILITETYELAARAYDQAAMYKKGNEAVTNFNISNYVNPTIISSSVHLSQTQPQLHTLSELQTQPLP